MSIFREIPPTAGFPVYVRDFLSLFNIKERKGCLSEDLRAYLKANYVTITYSGTSALYLILEALRGLSSKKTVIIPSYICPLVALAVKRANLKIEICDIDTGSFNYNYIELEELCSKNDDILAIVCAHLAGFSLDFAQVERIAKKYSIFTIEDCAQSLGAEYKGKKIGTLGDFSFFSFCRGKGLTIYEGGAIVTNNEKYAALISEKEKQLVKKYCFAELLKILELIGYTIFYRPVLFWFVFKLPKIWWNLRGEKLKALGEDYGLNFSIHKVSNFRKLIGHITFRRLDEQIIKQKEKADYYLKGLKDVKGIKIINHNYDKATYPFLTLVFDSKVKKEKAWEVLGNCGLGVSWFYTLAITDYDYLKDIIPERNCHNSRFLAEHQITLSTSIFLRTADLDLIINKLKNL